VDSEPGTPFYRSVDLGVEEDDFLPSCEDRLSVDGSSVRTLSTERGPRREASSKASFFSFSKRQTGDPTQKLNHAHQLAERYTAAAGLVNIGVDVIIAGIGEEARKILKAVGVDQPLLPKYKSLADSISALMPLQSRLTASKATQLQLALISTHQILKPKLANLSSLASGHTLVTRLSESLRKDGKLRGTELKAEPAALLTQLTKRNNELYDIIGQLAIALQACEKMNASYDPFEDVALLKPFAFVAVSPTAPRAHGFSMLWFRSSRNS